MFISTIVLGELYVWAHRRDDPFPLLKSLETDLLRDVTVLDFDRPCAEEFGRTRARMLRDGVTGSRLDLLIASVALVHDLTVVTHNTNHFALVPGLQIVDWLS